MHHLLIDIPTKLESERLLLQPYKPGDGKWLHQMFQENKTHLFQAAIEPMKAGFGIDVTTPEGAEIYVRQLAADWVARKRFIFGVWEKETNRYVGEIWIECQDWDIPLHEIGYFVVKDHLGHGFATEAANAALNFIFNDLNANKASLTCDEDNVPSYRVAERCGFVREGHLRKQTKRSDGTLVGKLCYGLLRTEFESH